jgi:cell division septation protein DedD
MVRNYLVAFAFLLAFSAPVSAQSVKAGIEAWQRADYPAAVAIWRPLAEKGDADAAFNLGQAYRLGRGVPTNLSIAKSWFERAARQNHVDAQTTLGLLLFQNGDQAEGLKWLKAAAEQGEARALLVYGTALFNGDGVTQDPVLGYAFVSRAAAQGLGPAKDTLAQLDTLMPLDQRKKGVAIARTKAKAAPPPPVAKPAKPAKPVQVATAQPAAAQPRPKPAPPTPRPAAAPSAAPSKAPAPASGAWRIQLGAFSQRGSAEGLYRKLSGNGALAGRHAFYIPVGAITRLQVGPFESKAAAATACKAVGTACFPVPAK